MADESDLNYVLGELKGKMDMMLENQKSHGKKIDALDSRLGKVEIKAATNGMFAGGIAA
ncbi:MAG: hypothetical protein GQ532_10010, partial [Methylomarinum sp.]|nr:hypothetical protein [Methylomarinum sp.]